MSLAALALASHLAFAVHPSVLYSAADVPRLRQPSTPAAKEIHDTLVAGAGYASSAPGSYGYSGDALYVFALDCAFTGDSTICQGAHDWLTWLVAQPAWEGTGSDPVDMVEANDVLGAAIAYDVLSDPGATIPAAARLSASDASAARQRLASEAGRIYDQSASGQHPTWWATEYLQNHNWFDTSALGVAAMALNGDLSPDPTCDWLAAVVADYSKVDVGLRTIADGTWHEGYSYEGSSISAWLGFVIPFERARKAGATSCPGASAWPDFADVPFFHAWPHYRAVSSLPGREHEAIVMHGDWFGWSADQAVMTYRFAAAHFGDAEAEWLAQAHLKASPHDTWGYEQQATALEYLVYDASVSPTAPTATDLFLSDMQGYVARSGWTAQSVVLGVKAGSYGGTSNWAAVHGGTSPAPDLDFGHDHDDDLGFWLYGGGEWLAPEADGYAEHGYCTASDPHVWNASYHNTLTVDGMGPMGDDETCRDTGDGKIPWTRASGVTSRASVRDHVYVDMDGTALYPSSLALDRVRRQVTFVDRSCVVVRDTLHGAAPHTWEWHVHAIDAVVQDGSWLRGESKNDQALGVDVVEPASWSVEVTTDALPHGPNPGTYIDPDQDITHARVYPKAPTADGRFLVVMCPTTTSGWSAKPAIARLGAAGTARGFTMTTGATSSAWLFADDATTPVTDGAQRSLTGAVGGAETTGSTTTYVLIEGSAVGSEGHEVLSGDAMTGAIEAVVEGSAIAVSADGATRARVYAPGGATATWNGAPAKVTKDPKDARYVLIGGTEGGDAGAGASAEAGAGAGAGAEAGAGAGAEAGAGANTDTSADTGTSGCGCTTAGSPGAPAWLLLSALLCVMAGRRSSAARCRRTSSSGTPDSRTSSRCSSLRRLR